MFYSKLQWKENGKTINRRIGKSPCGENCRPLKEAPQVFLTAWDLGANISRALKMSTCKTIMAARYDRTLVIWKQFNTIQFLCGGICIRIIHGPFYAWKSGQPKREHCGSDCKKATDSKVSACSDTDLGEVLFHYVMFCDKENRGIP